MTQERHADLLMHPGDSDQNHPLHRAQIRRRFRYGVYAALGLLLLGAVATISLRINDAHALEDVTAAQSQPHVMTVQASSNSRAEPIILPGTLQGKI